MLSCWDNISPFWPCCLSKGNEALAALVRAVKSGDGLVGC